MENGFCTRNQQKNHKNKNRKRKRRSQVINDCKTDTQKENFPKDKQCEQLTDFSNKNVPSPRPKILLNTTFEFETKRGSGSELEEFQTPSIEYDVKDEKFDSGDIKRDYDGEWEDMGSFQNGDQKIEKEIMSLVLEKNTNDDKTDCNVDQETGPVLIENTFVEIQGFEIGYLRDEENKMIAGSEECQRNGNETTVGGNNLLVEEETISAEKYMFVNEYFEDFDEHCLIEEAGYDGPFNDFINEPDIEEPDVVTREENEDNATINYDISNLVCTDENIQGETLFIPHVMLDVSYQPLLQKSLSLKNRPSELSFNQSATSITNVTSISDDNIPLKVEKDNKSSKKKKTNTFNIYQLFFKKLHKNKTPEKNIQEFTELGKNLSLDNLSDQSLKSINDFENVSQICDLELDKEIHKIESSIEITDDRDIILNTPSTQATDNKNATNKSRFKNLWKKKSKPKNGAKENITDKYENIQQSENVNGVLKCPDETVNDCNQLSSDSNVDLKIGHSLDHDCDDHLFPDSITATKIEKSTPFDIPFIDDIEVSILDSTSLYSGESRRPRLISKFWVPMASMESLYHPNESIEKEIIQKALISQSPFRKKRVLGSILGCISKGR